MCVSSLSLFSIDSIKQYARVYCLQYYYVFVLHQMLKNIFLEGMHLQIKPMIKVNLRPLNFQDNHSSLFPPGDVFTISPQKLSSSFVTTHFQSQRLFPFHYIAIVGRSHQGINFFSWAFVGQKKWMPWWFLPTIPTYHSRRRYSHLKKIPLYSSPLIELSSTVPKSSRPDPSALSFSPHPNGLSDLAA